MYFLLLTLLALCKDAFYTTIKQAQLNIKNGLFCVVYVFSKVSKSMIFKHNHFTVL